MPITRRAFITTGGSGLAGASLLASIACSRTSWEQRVAGIEKRIRESMAARQVPGVSIALIRNATIAWTGHFGVRNLTTGVPVDDATVFSAQSMSKPVFAYRVMKLAEQGVLDLDAPLTRYTRDLFVKDDPRLHQITARRVLSHTTGLPNWRTPDDPLRINSAPGSKWSYSGEGYHYLQSIVSRLKGRVDGTQCSAFEMGYRVCATDFGEYMEANLLRPFGMRSSGYAFTPEMQRMMAAPHGADGKLLPNDSPTAPIIARYGSAGALMTTASDYARFLIEVMQPKPADDYRLNAASLAEMLKPQIAAGESPFKASWALGWQIWHLEPGTVVAHGGDFDGRHSQSAFSPQRKNGFVVLTNGEGGLPLIWTDLLEPLLDGVVFA
jgi:CubicO group peptidase (beta-lactamase class C family)